NNESDIYLFREYLQYLRASAARLDGVPVSLSARDIGSERTSIVQSRHLFARSLVGALRLTPVDVSLDASSGAVVVISTSLPGGIKSISGLE
ncbi:hypothetical protein PENTCL1PPCAC_6513, partial [Pristionchus entomophagus]